MSQLNQEDYKTVLNYYNLNIPKNRSQIKQKAEDIIAQKLCNCVKKINTSVTEQPQSIGICKNSVLKKKNLKIYKFKCGTRKASLIGKTYRGKKLLKTGKISTRKKKK